MMGPCLLVLGVQSVFESIQIHLDTGSSQIGQSGPSLEQLLIFEFLGFYMRLNRGLAWGSTWAVHGAELEPCSGLNQRPEG